MRFGRSSRTLGAVTEADFVKLHQLRRMRAIALWLLLGMAVVFAVSFALQDRYPVFGFIRAASEGGMVGAIADWFAVTALFRKPLGLPIPHTNLIAHKKDDIGEGLGSFIEENFLADDVVHDKLSTVSGARIAGHWLKDQENAEKISELAATIGLSALTVLDDRDVQELLEGLARTHVIDIEWSPTIGRVLDQTLEGGHDETVIDMLADHVHAWLIANPQAFDRIVSSRLPAWLPGIASRLVDKRLYTEAVKFVDAIRVDRHHPFRTAMGTFLRDLATDLGQRPTLMEAVEDLKREMFDSPRIRSVVETSWEYAKQTLAALLADRESTLRKQIAVALQDFGSRLLNDSTLQFKIDVWVMTAVEYLVSTYRSDIAQVVIDTVQDWDATEATEKIELQIGKDLQFIRINGTIVGSLAGLTIYSTAVLISTLAA